MSADDYIPAAISLYLDITNLFLHILRVLAEMSGGREWFYLYMPGTYACRIGPILTYTIHAHVDLAVGASGSARLLAAMKSGRVDFWTELPNWELCEQVLEPRFRKHVRQLPIWATMAIVSCTLKRVSIRTYHSHYSRELRARVRTDRQKMCVHAHIYKNKIKASQQ